MEESDAVRQQRLTQASQEALARRKASSGLIPPPAVSVVEEAPVKAPNPLEDSTYDALIYLREGMSRKEVIDIILMRNRIKKVDVEAIVDQTIAQMKKGTDAKSQ